MRDATTYGRTHARAHSRKQATRFAVLAFVAADCAGVYYVQHRLDSQADAAAALAYETPGAPALTGPGSLTFTPDAPSLALNAPVAGVPAAVPAPVGAPVAVPAVAPALASAAPVAAPRFANPLTAQRVAPAAGLGAPRMAVRLEPVDEAAPALRREPAKTTRTARASVHDASHSAPAANLARSSVFDSAFSLADEAPDSEHRFGQSPDGADGGNVSGSVSGTGLAGLVIPREETAPMFDKAGIAPVTGQAATVDVPAASDVPADGAGAELPPIKG